MGFLSLHGAAPRQSPQLQNWLTLLANYVDEGVGTTNLYHSATGTPTVPTDLDALFSSTPTADTVVFWTDTSTGYIYIYIYDASADSWIAGPNTASGGLPAGTMLPFAGDGTAAAALADDYLICYGQAVSRATYADLFAVVGTTYGSGDGSTTFNLPDMRGRVFAGQDNMGGSSANRVTDTSADSIGGVMGAETHTLITSEIPSHSHGERAYNSALSAFANVYEVGGSAQGNDQSLGGNPSPTGYLNKAQAAQTTSTGGNGAHNNMQPTMFGNYIIKT